MSCLVFVAECEDLLLVFVFSDTKSRIFGFLEELFTDITLGCGRLELTFFTFVKHWVVQIIVQNNGISHQLQAYFVCEWLLLQLCPGPSQDKANTQLVLQTHRFERVSVRLPTEPEQF